LGRGAGDLAIEAARHGAARVTAIDMALYRMQLAEAKLEAETLPVRISRFRGELAPPGDEPVDLVLASQCFSGYWAEASNGRLESLVEEMSRPLRQGGLLAIEFRPPWKAPFGGAAGSRMPWAHLIFPESVIFDEFRRVRPDSTAHSFADIGINKVTVASFRRAMAASGLECLYLRTNVGDRRLAATIRVLANLPPLREYLTQNIYGVWRRG
jgi:SAM-dependent methyltransferase